MVTSTFSIHASTTCPIPVIFLIKFIHDSNNVPRFKKKTHKILSYLALLAFFHLTNALVLAFVIKLALMCWPSKVFYSKLKTHTGNDCFETGNFVYVSAVVTVYYCRDSRRTPTATYNCRGSAASAASDRSCCHLAVSPFLASTYPWKPCTATRRNRVRNFYVIL